MEIEVCLGGIVEIMILSRRLLKMADKGRLVGG